MKKILLTAGLLASLVSSAIAGSYSDFLQSVGINVTPVISNFKGDIGSGVEFGIGYKGYIVNYVKVNGNLQEKNIVIDTPYYFFIKSISIKTNSTKHFNNFLGIKYITCLNKTDDNEFVIRKHKQLIYLVLRGGISINNNNPYYVSLLLDYDKKLNNKLYYYNQVGFNKYEFGNEFFLKLGVSYEF